MDGELTVVFPRAGSTGGVERVALELLRFEAPRRRTRFVGRTLDEQLPGIRHDVVTARRGPLAFRRGAAAALALGQHGTTISFGVECPPGDVFWVHSVHAAWLSDGGEIRIRGHAVPAAGRRLLPRHQVLLRLERGYFGGPLPRMIICTSEHEVADLARFYGVPRDRTTVVPNGYDGAQFSPARRTALRDPARAAIGANPDDVVVLMVANEWHRKGLAPLLEAVALVADARLRIDLVGRRDPAAYRPMADRLGLADRLHWHGPSTDVAPFYAAADVFALPTAYEPFGIVIVEAMASGLPVVVPRFAGAAVAVHDGINGLLLDDPRDVPALAGALTRLLDLDTRLRLGAAAGTSVGDYEWARVLDRVDGIVFPS